MSWGLETGVPESGIGSDGYSVAATAVYLYQRKPNMDSHGLRECRHAVTLHRISGRLHRLDGEACNRELTAREESRLRRLEQGAEEIAAFYGLRAYHQGDPRGCALYLTEPGMSDYSRGLAIVRLGR